MAKIYDIITLIILIGFAVDRYLFSFIPVPEDQRGLVYGIGFIVLGVILGFLYIRESGRQTEMPHKITYFFLRSVTCVILICVGIVIWMIGTGSSLMFKSYEGNFEQILALFMFLVIIVVGWVALGVGQLMQPK